MNRKFVTFACKLIDVYGDGQYALTKFRNQDYKVIKCYKWNLEDDVKQTLKSKFHFVRFKIIRDKLYVWDIIPMNDLVRSIIEERYKKARDSS